MDKTELDKLECDLSAPLGLTIRERRAGEALHSLRAENERMRAVCEAAREMLHAVTGQREIAALKHIREALANLDATDSQK